jgi:hypothetical protein
VYLDLSVTDAQEFAGIDQATVYADLTASSQDVLEAVDAAEAYLDLVASGVEFREIPAESAEIPLLLQPSTVELAEFVDVELVYLDIVPSGVDIRETAGADVATVYLDLQPGYLRVDFVLEVVGMTTRWQVTVPLTARYEVLELITRWALMDSRRFTWRS